MMTYTSPNGCSDVAKFNFKFTEPTVRTFVDYLARHLPEYVAS